MYLTGLNLEQGDQFREAIRAYQSVLQQVEDHTPIKEAAAQLKELRRAHPGAFESAPEKEASAEPQTRPAAAVITR